MAFVFIIGAFLFSIDRKLPAYASLPMMVGGFILTFFLKDSYIPHAKLTIKKSKDAAMNNFFASFIQLGLLLVLIIIDGIIVL